MKKAMGALVFDRPQSGYGSSADNEKPDQEPCFMRFVDGKGNELAQLKSLQLQPLKNLSNAIVSEIFNVDVI